MKNKATSIRRKLGDIFLIPLGEEWFGFGRILPDFVLGFYNFRSKEVPSTNEIVGHDIAFSTYVHKSGFTSRKWTIIGNVSLTDALKERPVFLSCRVNDKGDPMLSFDGGQYWPTTPEDAKTREVLAVWEPEHIEDRLRNHFDGTPCKWLETLAMTV